MNLGLPTVEQFKAMLDEAAIALQQQRLNPLKHCRTCKHFAEPDPPESLVVGRCTWPNGSSKHLLALTRSDSTCFEHEARFAAQQTV